MAGVDGIEPSHVGVKVRCLTAWLHPCVVGWVMGIEPMHNGATIRRVNRFTIPTTGYLFCLALSCLTTIFSISVNFFRVNHFLKNFFNCYHISSSILSNKIIALSLMFLKYIKKLFTCKPLFSFFFHFITKIEKVKGFLTFSILYILLDIIISIKSLHHISVDLIVYVLSFFLN